MAQRVELTLVLRQTEAAKAIGASLLDGTYTPSHSQPAAIGANPADVQAVERFAAEHNLHVVKVDTAARTVRVVGTISAVEKAFGIAPGAARSLEYRGPANLPTALEGRVIAVLGLDQRPVARPLSDV